MKTEYAESEIKAGMERKYKKKYRHLFVALLVMIVLFFFGIKKINEAVLQDAQETGRETANLFAVKGEAYLKQYETILDTVEYQLRPENRTGDLAKILKQYMEFVYDTMEVDEVEVYASIDGKVVGATFWSGDEELNPLEKEWYQAAIGAGGDTIYTGSYTDVRLKKQVVTLAKQIQGTQDVAAVDIYPGGADRVLKQADIPKGSNYFLCDQNGVLMEYNIQGMEKETVQERFNPIFQEILEGKHDFIDSEVIGVDGIRRGVYYYKLKSGWYSVITIPYEELMELSYEFRLFGGMVIAVFLAAILLLLLNDFRTLKKARGYNEIVEVLSNSYYALYRIDLERNQYEMMKGSDYVRDKIPINGDYSHMLEVVKDVIKEEDYKEFLESFSADNMRKLVKKRERNFGGDFRRLFNGKYRWVHVQMLFDESIQKNSVVLCFNDVNDRKEQELSRLEFMKNSLESVDRMSKSRNLFFSQMSHDMRTPLNGIIGLTNLVLNDLSDREKVKDSLKKIEALGKQLLELINDILNIAKMEEGKLEIRREEFSMRKNLDELISVFQLQAENLGKNFQVHVDIEDSCLEGDWGKVQQILNNLLSNAFKFTEDQGNVEFTVHESKDSNSRYRNYCFTVKDDGVGMSQKFLERIFIPFERDVQFGASKVAGTGLGMAIVHELVQRLEGTIEIESEIGKGSIFRVMLPCSVSERKCLSEERLQDTVEMETQKEERSEEQSLEGKRVLLAEDNEINMEITVGVLEMYGLKVTQAWNGREALQAYLEQEDGYFDFILMDMQMPEMDGCQSAEAIRKSGRMDAGRIPIIAVTANAFTEDIARTQKAGMNAHISKPIDFKILEETMKKFYE